MSHKCYKCGDGLDKASIARAEEIAEETGNYHPENFICWECDREYMNNEPDYEQASDCDPGL